MANLAMNGSSMRKHSARFATPDRPAAEDFAQPEPSLSTATAGKGAKSAGIHLGRIDLAELRGDDLHGPLIKLGRAPQRERSRRCRTTCRAFRWRSKPGRRSSRCGRKARPGDRDFRCGLAGVVCRRRQNLVDRLLMAEFTDVASRHGGIFGRVARKRKTIIDSRARKSPPQGGRGTMKARMTNDRIAICFGLQISAFVIRLRPFPLPRT